MLRDLTARSALLSWHALRFVRGIEREAITRVVHAPHGTVDRLGDRLGQRRLSHARNVVDEQVALGQQAHQGRPDDIRRDRAVIDAWAAKGYIAQLVTRIEDAPPLIDSYLQYRAAA